MTAPSATASAQASPTLTPVGPLASATSAASQEVDASPSQVPVTATTRTPTRVSTNTAPETGTKAVTTTPTLEATVTSTQTPVPTATPSRTPTSAPTRTASPTRRPATATPVPTEPPPTVGVQYPAPALISPFDGQVFSERDRITLSWQPVGQLAPNEYYVPTVAFSPYREPGATWYDETVPWLKETNWNLSEHRWLLDESSDGQFRWAVRVLRRTGINEEGRPEGVAASPLSAVRTLIWKAPTEGGGGGTPAPPEP
jgi:hypothetical protein